MKVVNGPATGLDRNLGANQIVQILTGQIARNGQSRSDGGSRESIDRAAIEIARQTVEIRQYIFLRLGDVHVCLLLWDQEYYFAC